VLIYKVHYIYFVLGEASGLSLRRGLDESGVVSVLELTLK